MKTQKVNSGTPNFGMIVEVNESRLKRLGQKVLDEAKAAAKELEKDKRKAFVKIDQGYDTVFFNATNTEGLTIPMGIKVPTNEVSAFAMALKQDKLTILDKIKILFGCADSSEVVATTMTKEGIEKASAEALTKVS